MKHIIQFAQGLVHLWVIAIAIFGVMFAALVLLNGLGELINFMGLGLGFEAAYRDKELALILEGTLVVVFLFVLFGIYKLGGVETRTRGGKRR